MTVFTPTGSGTVPIGGYGTNGNGAVAAVSFANGNGLLFGFGIEAISDSTNIGNSDRADFMTHIYAWAGELLGTDPQYPTTLPTKYSLGAAYPNPFNSSTSLPYVLPQSGGYFDVFDVLGRQVSAGELLGGTGRLHWSFDGPSGIYFVNLRWNGGQAAPVKVVLLR
jgi:hypothetical protein